MPKPLSANESPHDTLPGIAEAVAHAGQAANRYPDPGCKALTGALARALDVDEGRIVVGAGSVSLLQLLFQAVGEPGAEVVYAWPSFELYPVLAQLAGVASMRVPLARETHDLRLMAKRISSRARLVVVCNPNNPTGTVAPGEELDDLLSLIPPTCLVAFDEAYFEYVRDPGTRSALDFCAAHPNVVVLRTFSKAYGLAGLRVGYLVGDSRVTTRLRKGLLPYSVAAVAQAAAVAALDLADQLSARVEDTCRERTRVSEALRTAGWEIPPSQANFIWLPLLQKAALFGEWCTRRGVAVRMFPGLGIRVTIGTAEDNDAFLGVAAQWVAEGRAKPEGGRRAAGSRDQRA
jgi:histidinol-phosphate aminotransferase